jgi:multiple sugar transport system substrate-binding protein
MRGQTRRAALTGGALGTAGALAALAACGQPQQAAPGPGAAQNATVGFIIWGAEEERRVHEATKQGFERAYPNLKLDLTVTPLGDPSFNYEDKVRAMIAADSSPDVIRVNVRAFQPTLLPLDDYVKRDRDFDLPDYIPSVLETGRWRGQLLQVVGKLGPQVTYFNTRHFQEQGLTTPAALAEKGAWTFDAFLQAATRLTVRRDGEVRQYGYIPYTGFWTWVAMAGGKPFNATYSEGYLDRAENHDPVQYRADLVLKHKVAHGADDPAPMKSWQGFTGGFGAMFISGPWQMARIKPRLSDPWDIAPPPLQRNGRPQMGIGGESIWKGSKIPDAAFKYLAFMEGKEGQRIWSRTGTDLPGRKSVMAEFVAGKLFEDATLAPPNSKVWGEVTPRCEPTALLPKEANDAYNAAWADVQAGKTGAREAFTQANKLAAAALKDQ